ncbi:hypothetical protein D3C81_1658600 [compost metagenome]
MFVLGAIDSAQACFDADGGQIFDIRLQNSLQVWIDQQDFHAQGLPLAVQQALPGQLPAGLAKQAQGAAQGFARDTAAIGTADAVGLGKQAWRQMVAFTGQQ